MVTSTAARRSGNPAKKAAATPRKVAVKKTADHKLPAADITINPEPKKKVSIDLIGERYLITPPKASLAVAITQGARNPDEAEEAFAKLQDWIDLAFGVKIAVKIRERLDDPKDDLDLDHIMKLMNALMELGGENPTT